MTPLQTLLAHSIDYAGLFPPAGLDMQSAVRNYAEYSSGSDAWALGRFIVPVARLGEFSTALTTVAASGQSPWRVSALGSTDVNADMEVVQDFNERHQGLAVIETFERKASGVDEIEHAARAIPAGLQTYFEIPIDSNLQKFVDAIARVNVRAKARAGGVTADAFPSAVNLIRFMQTCITSGVPFKATAGLHHPLRSMQKLTYEPNAPSGMMFGFLNVFLAAAFLRNGMKDDEALLVLEEQSPNAFRFDQRGVQWQGHSLDNNQLRDMRTSVAIAFGSCSFREPFDGLRSMNFL